MITRSLEDFSITYHYSNINVMVVNIGNVCGLLIPPDSTADYSGKLRSLITFLI